MFLHPKLLSVFIGILLLSGFNHLFAYERSDSFIVKVFSNKVKVLAPVKIGKKVFVLVENKSLSKILGEIKTESNHRFGFVAIAPRKNQVVEISFKRKEKIYFVSLSPAFQEVELKVGEKAYEIPPQR